MFPGRSFSLTTSSTEFFEQATSPHGDGSAEDARGDYPPWWRRRATSPSMGVEPRLWSSKRPRRGTCLHGPGRAQTRPGTSAMRGEQRISAIRAVIPQPRLSGTMGECPSHRSPSFMILARGLGFSTRFSKMRFVKTSGWSCFPDGCRRLPRTKEGGVRQSANRAEEEFSEST